MATAANPAPPDPPRPARRFALGRTLFAFVLFASPGLIAAAVVLPLLRANWWPIAMWVFAGLSLMTLILALLVGWLIRPADPATLDQPADDGPRFTVTDR